ncbi:MAG: transcription termination/antitermination protein NusA [Candidatus Schekmanbacteria bacterium]|nr:transcription termination/antitermination protein NusA [Candidatus Schekmanbacteria bacterium]
MNRELLQVIDQIERERGISREIIIEAVEAAVISASRRRLGTGENLEAILSRDSGEIEVYALKSVVAAVENAMTQISLEDARTLVGEDIAIGDEIEIRKEIEGLGRIAAQTAKQVILQRVRDAERELVFEKYRDRQGELINGVVARVDRGNVYVDLGRCEALLPSRELGPRDHFRRGDRIRAFILEVRQSAQGHQIILSRTHAGLLRRLFELEVPEVYEGIVEILGSVREPGGRGKISVVSHDANVDPVGACVGMKGSRVQAVVRELRGENIDIIPFSENPKDFIANALSPAHISRIALNEAERRAEVVVDESQLSLAIGKRGQNVRLAAKLTGWHIDIGAEGGVAAAVSGAADDGDEMQTTIDALQGLDSRTREALQHGHIQSCDEIVKMDVAELARVTGVAEVEAEALIHAAEQALRRQVDAAAGNGASEVRS